MISRQDQDFFVACYGMTGGSVYSVLVSRFGGAGPSPRRGHFVVFLYRQDPFLLRASFHPGV